MPLLVTRYISIMRNRDVRSVKMCAQMYATQRFLGPTVRNVGILGPKIPRCRHSGLNQDANSSPMAKEGLRGPGSGSRRVA